MIISGYRGTINFTAGTMNYIIKKRKMTGSPILMTVRRRMQFTIRAKQTSDDDCNGCSSGYDEQSLEKPITSLIMIPSYAINMIFNHHRNRMRIIMMIGMMIPMSIYANSANLMPLI